MPDGKSIISGWSDGKIRAFGPQSGKLLYTILDAHTTVRIFFFFTFQVKRKRSMHFIQLFYYHAYVQGVTAIYGTSDSTRIVSGGKEGQVIVLVHKKGQK